MFKKKEKVQNIDTLEKQENTKKRSKFKQLFPYKTNWYTYLLLFIDACAICCFVVFYHDASPLKNWLVSTAMSTTTHQYLAYTFYEKDEIQATLDRNKTIESGESTDLDSITFTKTDTSHGYKNAYEQRVLENPNNDEFKMVEISEDNWRGWMVVVYHPEKLNLAICKGYPGDRCTYTAKRYKSRLVFNAGIFTRMKDDAVFPAGTVISNGKVINSVENEGNIIGMTFDGKLVLTRSNTNDAIKKYNLKWACEMSPFLIINGEKAKFTGNGGYGTHPRTAIGQRADGIMIVLVIDGRQVTSSGVTVVTLANIFEKYGCVNAANLDGGGSSTLVVDGELINNPQNGSRDFERYVYDSIYLEP